MQDQARPSPRLASSHEETHATQNQPNSILSLGGLDAMVHFSRVWVAMGIIMDIGMSVQRRRYNFDHPDADERVGGEDVALDGNRDFDNHAQSSDIEATDLIGEDGIHGDDAPSSKFPRIQY